MLTSELDLAEIVRQVLVRAIEVIPAADAGTLFLVEPESGRLIVSDSVGFGPSIFNLSLEPGEAARLHCRTRRNLRQSGSSPECPRERKT
jgi:hypothetical protein